MSAHKTANSYKKAPAVIVLSFPAQFIKMNTSLGVLVFLTAAVYMNCVEFWGLIPIEGEIPEAEKRKHISHGYIVYQDEDCYKDWYESRKKTIEWILKEHGPEEADDFAMEAQEVAGSVCRYISGVPEYCRYSRKENPTPGCPLCCYDGTGQLILASSK